MAELLVVFFPTFMLFTTSSSFGTNWENHVWHIAYFAEYLRNHGAFPTVVSTIEQLHLPVPLFYGYLFHPLLGLLAVPLGASLALKLAVVAVLWAQFRVVRGALVRAWLEPRTAGVVACLVTWAVYPLNSLYTWHLITEFFAAAFLTCALAYWFELLLCPDDERLRKSTALGLCWCLMAGTHPITGAYGSLALLTTMAASVVLTRRYRALPWVVPQLALTALCLSAWLFALRSFRPFLAIVTETTREVSYYPDVDSLLGRLVPYARAPKDLLAPKIAPYITATANVALLLFAAALASAAWRRTHNTPGARRRVLIVALSGAAVFATLFHASLSPWLFGILPPQLRVIQFAARLVTYQNLALLCVVFGLSLCARGLAAPRWAAIACLVVAASFAAVKLDHAWLVRQRGVPPPIDRELPHLPRWYLGLSDYATPSLFPKLARAPGVKERQVHIPIGLGANFGLALPLQLELEETSLLLTNVLAFPWSTLVLDGEPVAQRTPPDTDQPRLARYSFAVLVPRGHHQLEARFEPDRRWLFLRNAGFAVLLAWVLSAAILRGLATPARPKEP
ncbi:MAG: hypothetical protein HY075_02940 [Deltaproteobacteria bacterium]|nr:hypothetical protein [Deltaproteobacteria bacterium]